ncbi:MAG TPA: tetraacyldisaccharide 4'-kinase [Terracidiphilus sp.]|nr:tetraacyldisaccharide 4'-kinase [Terracidiphilus sp.]
MKRPWLLPFVPLFAAGVALHNLRIRLGWEPVRRLSWPVISIGNLSTGGAGKTPLAVALAHLLAARGFYVDVLSRGYGRRSVVAARVLADGVAEDFGDEPLLLARQTGIPVFVGAERFDAGLLAESEMPQNQTGRPSVHLLDDGYQHRHLARNIDILLLSRADWQDVLLPAGDLREGRSAARRASVLVIPSSEPEFDSELRAWGWQGPIWRLHRHMQLPPLPGPVAAFCGIARPAQFFSGIRAAGSQIAVQTEFRDHHRFAAADIYRLIAAAHAAGAAAFLTTEKDLVRLGSLGGVLRDSMPLFTAHLQVELEDEADAIGWLLERLSPVAGQPPV